MRGYAGGGCEEGKDGASLMRRNKCRESQRDGRALWVYLKSFINM